MPRRKTTPHPPRPERTDASEIVKTKFECNHISCKTVFQAYYFIDGRPMPVYLDKFYECDCKCHRKK